jgi:hypothetical protein
VPVEGHLGVTTRVTTGGLLSADKPKLEQNFLNLSDMDPGNVLPTKMSEARGMDRTFTRQKHSAEPSRTQSQLGRMEKMDLKHQDLLKPKDTVDTLVEKMKGLGYTNQMPVYRKKMSRILHVGEVELKDIKRSTITHIPRDHYTFDF